MKISELRDKSLEELTQLLDEKQLDAFRIRMAKATGQLGNTHEVRVNRLLIEDMSNASTHAASNGTRF